MLFVCKGNIFRSAFAEWDLNAFLDREGIEGVVVGSAGTAAYHVGKGAHPIAISVAEERGVDLSRHVARVVDSKLLHRADMVVAMDSTNLITLRVGWREWAGTVAAADVRLLGEFGLGGVEIPDPYERGREEVRRAFDKIRRCVVVLGGLLAHRVRTE